MDDGDRIGDESPPGRLGSVVRGSRCFRTRRLATDVRLPSPRLFRAEVLVVSVFSAEYCTQIVYVTLHARISWHRVLRVVSLFPSKI